MHESGATVSSRRWTSLIGASLSVWLSRRSSKLSEKGLWAARSGAIQRAQLRDLLVRASGTEIGRAAGFSRLAAMPDEALVRGYREAVPIVDYEGYRERFVRMREHGEPDVTWPGVVRDWAQTSGTTGGEKYIPVSKEMMRSNYRAAMDIFAHAKRFGVSLPALFGGRLLFLGGSTDVSVNAHGIRTGDLSGLVTPLIRWPMSAVYSPGADVALMSDWPAKIEAMARLAMRQDIRMISGMASWSLVLYQRVLELSREQGHGSSALREVWPGMTLFVHGGVKYAPFDARVREAWSGRADLNDPSCDLPHRLEVYPASEGFIAMQDTPGDPGLRLSTDIGIFFEFVPVEEIDRDDARAFTCDRVDRGQRYVVVMSTCAGLWRYIIGDVVEFDTIPPDGPARLRIVGRHRHFINAFGENLIVEQIENAVAEAQRETGARVGEFTASPVYPGERTSAGLELAIEWEQIGDDPALAERFRDVFDASLKRQNADYRTKRTANLGMRPPTLTLLCIGAVHAWMESKGKLGGQHKAPRCANHRELLDELVLASGGPIEVIGPERDAPAPVRV